MQHFLLNPTMDFRQDDRFVAERRKTANGNPKGKRSKSTKSIQRNFPFVRL